MQARQSVICSDKRLGENLEGFPTQRATLEGENQLRWVSGLLYASRFAVRLPGLFCVYLSLVDYIVGKQGCDYLVHKMLLEWWEGKLELEDGRRKGRRNSGENRA